MQPSAPAASGLTVPVRIWGPADAARAPRAEAIHALDVTSRAAGWSRDLSPMRLGPVPLASGDVARTVEQAWQHSKVFADQWDATRGQPTEAWWAWAREGWAAPRASRFPRGRGARPVGTWVGGQLLDYLPARLALYLPLYRQALLAAPVWARIQQWATAETAAGRIPTLLDVDGWDRGDRALLDVVLDPSRPLAHAVVLALCLHYPDAARWDRLLAKAHARLVPPPARPAPAADGVSVGPAPRRTR